MSPPPKSTQTGNEELPVAGPSRPSRESENKENICIVIDDNDETYLGEEVNSDASIVTQGDADMEMELDEPVWHDVVEQEDGYISPTPSCSGDIQDLSSPIVPRHTPARKQEAGPRDSVDRCFGAEAVSSPPSQVKLKRRRPSDSTPQLLHRTRSLDLPRIHGHAAQRLDAQRTPGAPSASFPGVDLRHSFGDDRVSDIDCSDDDMRNSSETNSHPTPTPSTLAPTAQEDTPASTLTDDVLINPEDSEVQANELRKRAVITGWRERWAVNKAVGISKRATPKLKRRETNVTPTGRHTLSNAHTRPHPYPAPKTDVSIKPRRVQSRKSLPFLESAKKGYVEVIDLEDISNGGRDSDTALRRARLDCFR